MVKIWHDDRVGVCFKFYEVKRIDIMRLRDLCSAEKGVNEVVRDGIGMLEGWTKTS